MSSKSDIAISVRGLSKKYSIAHQGPKATTAAEALTSRFKNPMQKAVREDFWALRDVSFDIKKGDVVGIVGRNGAGKSTLLKVLSRITEPTSGEAILHGRVGSLLEVGTGFHPELTGRENIFLNGAILGMNRAEITRQFDAIVDFSGTEKFLDTPVKRYSSGMYVRLAFAVAAHLNPEILIVDEVLAVGDAEFQEKCLGKMRDVSQAGRTVILVSHQMQTVLALCTKGIYMKLGQVMQVGDTESIVATYLTERKVITKHQVAPHLRAGSGEARFESVSTSRYAFRSGDAISFNFAVSRRDFPAPMFVSFHVVNDKGIDIVQMDSRLKNYWLDNKDWVEGNVRFVTPWLKPGSYSVTANLCVIDRIVDAYEDSCIFTVDPILPYPAAVSEDTFDKAIVFADFHIS